MLMIGKLDSYDDFTISCKEEAEGLKHRNGSLVPIPLGSADVGEICAGSLIKDVTSRSGAGSMTIVYA